MSPNSSWLSKWLNALVDIFRKLLDAGLPEDTVFVKLEGSAGMFLPMCSFLKLPIVIDCHPFKLQQFQ